ncbi:MAG: SDR family NAD(P)-dependent oxidoreductase [Rickettsiaceae bacterium H1]|nr:SDR family NAD(P)-dependent oxidoreductase [Rickettsiaceae bacterium H1]
MYKNIAIIGTSGAIGKAFSVQLQQTVKKVYAFSRILPTNKLSNVKYYQIDYTSESSIKQAAAIASAISPLDLVLVATGILHDEKLIPEKSLRDISAEKFHHLFTANTITPALIAKYFLSKMHKNKRSIFAAISARVGSISDNKIGGWYGYRASKAALNMIIKNIAIEASRNYKEAIIVGLHPGTVDSNLSKPFQNHIPKNQVFTPEYSVKKLLTVLESLTTPDSGKCFAWDGAEVKP